MSSRMSSPARRARSPALVALFVALAMNLANLFEPLTVDDVCHHYYAAQVAHHPLQPLEFDIDWHQKPVPAWTVMVPPVMSYFWAPGVLLGELVPVAWQPVVWHLWFLPTQWLFCYSLLRLLQRWLRRGATAVTAAIALGPAVLPGINLMIEVPMLCLGLASMAALERAFERRSARMAMFAGLLWGLSLQTKYSAAGFFPPWFLLAALRGRWREWAIGIAVAAATVLSIEWLLSLSHGGGSYFMQRLGSSQVRSLVSLTKGMFQHVGALGMPAALLALVGLRAPRAATVAVLACYVGGAALVACCDEPERSLADGALDSVGYLALSLATWVVLAVLCVQMLRSAFAGPRRWPLAPSRALRVFLVGWFAGEIVSSYVISPFPAARRVLMVVVAFTVMAAWLAVRRAGALRAVRAIAVGSVLLGAVYQGVDYLEGRAWVTAADDVVQWAHARDAKARVFFVGGWGFEFYAPRAGMRPFLRGVTAVEPGDLVVCGSIDGEEVPWFEPDARLEQIAELPYGTDGVPLSTQFAYYSGERPLTGQTGPRYLVRVLRATRAFHASELTNRPEPFQKGP